MTSSCKTGWTDGWVVCGRGGCEQAAPARHADFFGKCLPVARLLGATYPWQGPANTNTNYVQTVYCCQLGMDGQTTPFRSASTLCRRYTLTRHAPPKKNVSHHQQLR
eukprot:45427-Chlamydomonas_euryale.AAC.1